MKKILAPFVATSFLAMSLSPAHAAFSEGSSAVCPQEVQDALMNEASNGAQNYIGIIRDRAGGISDPGSIWDLNCIDDLMDISDLRVLVDPDAMYNWLADLVKDQICEAYDDYVEANVNVEFDPAVFTKVIPRLPGLSINSRPVDPEEVQYRIEVEDSEVLGTRGGSVSSDELTQDLIDSFMGGN